MTELRYKILRLLEEREQNRSPGSPTVGEVADALQEPLRNVVVSIKSSEAMGMIAIHRYLGTEEKDWAINLKPAAFIYIESQLNATTGDLHRPEGI